MKALVVHPRFSVFGGGEFVCLNVILALREAGYATTLMSSDYDRKSVEEAFNFSEPLGLVNVALGGFTPLFSRGLALQRTFYARRERKETAEIYNDYEVIFHTQTAYFLGPPARRTFNIFYDPSDLLIIKRAAEGSSRIETPFNREWKKPYYWLCRKLSDNDESIRNAWNVPLSKALENYLTMTGYRHSQYVFPPCDLSFRALPKLPRVIQVTRVVPHKRLEDFMAVAQALPEYEFIIVGSISPIERRMHSHYMSELFVSMPSNVKYVEGRIRKMPMLLEASKVYLYTSHEPGINISTVQALGAGCIPVCPSIGGGNEIIEEAGIGYTYATVEEGVKAVSRAMNDETDPAVIATKARAFDAQHFRQNIRKMIE